MPDFLGRGIVDHLPTTKLVPEKSLLECIWNTFTGCALKYLSRHEAWGPATSAPKLLKIVLADLEAVEFVVSVPQNRNWHLVDGVCSATEGGTSEDRSDELNWGNIANRGRRVHGGISATLNLNIPPM